MPTSDLLRDKIKNLEFVTSASRMLNATLDLDQLLRVIMKIVKNALNVQAVSLSVADEEGENLVFELAKGRRDKAVRGLSIPFGEGIMGRVAQTKKPLVVNDTAGDERISLVLEKKLGLRPRSLMAIPLLRRGKLIGVLEVINQKRRKPFTEEDLSLAITLGEHIAIALANARLFERAERLGLEATLLARVSADMGKSLSLDEVLERILKNLEKLIPFNAAAVFVLDRRKNLIVSQIDRGYPKDSKAHINLKRDEGVVSVAIQGKRGIIVDDVNESDVYVNSRPSTRSEMVAPMISRGGVIGAF
ncbi:MAG: GAF domain-containing protein, partial [Candidatus Krumholzibacteria bacterium]|nr:GAF domain-containing protein [Candidatus Krumholzibacteria bacterium]